MKLLDKKDLLYLDNHILVVRKENNLLTQKDDTKRDSLEERVAKYLMKTLDKKVVFLHVVHRLDRVVGGIVLFARSSKALSRLNEAMRKKQISRTYQAFVEGFFVKKEGELVDYLIKKDFKTFVTKDKKDAKVAKLKYRVLEEKDNFSLVEIVLETGRYHQIRAQFANIDHPIVGDQKYGSSYKTFGIKLYQTKLEFLHPITKKLMSFEIDALKDLKSI